MVGGKGVRENEDNRIKKQDKRLNQKFLQLHQETKD